MYGYYDYYDSGSSPMMTFIVLIALALAIVSMVLIVPKKRRPTLNGFFKFVHDLFNFRFLLIEKIVQFAYIFTTFLLMVCGLFVMFSGSGQAFIIGLLFIVLGPVVVRLAYEGIMMFILLVKNVIEINNKTKDQNADSDKPSAFNASFDEYRQPQAPVQAPVQQPVQAPVQQPAPTTRYCTQCGTPYDPAQGGCPNCNK